MEINNNDFIWYYKFLNDDYYGRPISGISELKRNKVKDIKYESIYHNATKTIYELDNGESINDITWMVYDNEDIAIQHYNNSINQQIRVCNEHINKLELIKKELENKIIKEKLL